MNLIHSLFPSTRNQWIKLLVTLSLWNCYLLLAACLTTIVIGALKLDPSNDPLRFIFATGTLTLILFYYILLHTYVCL